MPTQPWLIALNMRDSADLGKAEFSALATVDDRTATNLQCERIYFAADKGICLSREIKFLSAQTVATLVDTRFQPLSSVRTDGIPSRARISADGRYAAFTVFVFGHSYADSQLSTATLLLDIKQGATIANLEEFKVLQDGRVIESVDFNYWGVTFQKDSNFFYATLRTGGINYLVRGDVRLRTATVIYKGVECPSLSPDETRIAFKKLVSRNNWRLTVLDLTTFRETPLTETRSVDDQAIWLDNDRVLYGLVDSAPWMSVMVVPADGTGQPNVFAKGAASPAVVTSMKPFR
jgi:dipeptidyl aminopeptidase/acylaminoacyl peptidase